MYQTITVIGVGSLGGFLCKHLSEIYYIKNINIIDHDIVESKNTQKSIYTYKDVGDFKVNALEEIIGNDVSVIKLREKYIEGITFLPKSDLIIDCRDMICNRCGYIDLKLYISGRTLMVDCRKIVNNICSYEGSYTDILTRSEINKAAFYASQIIETNEIENMIRSNSIQKINLDIISSIMNNSIRKSIKDKVDLLYDETHETRRIHCIEENIIPILNLNKKQGVGIFVGNKNRPVLEIDQDNERLEKIKYLFIPRDELKNPLDVINTLSKVMRSHPGVTNFVLSIRRERGEEFVELLEETGAA